MNYLDELEASIDQAAIDRMSAIRLYVVALGELIDAEDADTGPGASTYAAATFAVRDVYMELGARRRHPSG